MAINADTTTTNLGIIRPILDVQKEANKKVVKVGDEITYKVTVTNSGNTIGNAVITDTLPEGTEVISKPENVSIEGNKLIWNVEVEAENKVTVEYTIKVNEATKIINSVTINDDEDKKTEVVTPVIEIVKEAAEEVKPGEELTYTIKVTNTSDVDTEKVVVEDTIPANTIFVKADNGGALEENKVVWKDQVIKAGETNTYTLTVKVGEDVKLGTIIENTAIVDGSESNKETTEVKEARITGTKSVDKLEAKIGDTLTYTITLTNSGNATGKVNVEDKIPEGTKILDENTPNYNKETNSMVWKNIEVEKTVELKFQVVIDAVDDGKTVKNIAIIGEKDTDDNNKDPKDPSVETLIRKIDILKEYNIEKAEGNKAEAKVELGDKIKYTITVKNIGTATLNKVNVVDELVGLNETLETLIPGEERVYNKDYQVTQEDVDSKENIQNVATVTVPEGPSDKAEVNTPVVEKVKNISIDKVYTIEKAEGNTTKDKAEVGDKIKYTITVVNIGNVTLNNVIITDSMKGKVGFEISEKELKIDKLLPGAKKEIKAIYTVQESDVGENENTITNTATVKSDETGPKDSTVNTKTVKYISDIKVFKKVNTTTAKVGEVLTYTITLQNDGNKEDVVKITDKLPAGIVVKEDTLTSSGGKYDKENNTIEWTKNVGKENVIITFEVIVMDNQIGKTLTNNVELDNGNKSSATTEISEKKVVVNEKIPGESKNDNVNIILVMDTSNSMNRNDKDSKQTKLQAAKTVATNFVEKLYNNPLNKNATISLVTFDEDARTIFKTKTINEKENIKEEIAGLKTKFGTAMYNGLEEAKTLISGIDNGNRNVLILLGDGKPYPYKGNNTEKPIVSKARDIEKINTEIYTIGFGLSNIGEEDEDANEKPSNKQEIAISILKQVASSEDKFNTAVNGDELAKIFDNIAESINKADTITTKDGILTIKATRKVLISAENPLIVEYDNKVLYTITDISQLAQYDIKLDSKTNTITWDINAWNSREGKTRIKDKDTVITYYINK